MPAFHWTRWLFAFVWIGCHVGLFTWAYFEELGRKDNAGNKRALGQGLLIARSSARCLNFDMALVLIPICRNLLSLLRRIPLVPRLIPFEHSTHFHKVIAYTIVLFTAVHTMAHYVNYYTLGKAFPSRYSAFSLNWTSWSGSTGIAMIASLFLMTTSAAGAVRRRMFELFWYTHHLWVVFYAAALLHTMGCLLKTDDGQCYQKTTYKWVSAGLALYGLEMVLRWWRALFQTTGITKVIQHPSRVVEIQFSKPAMTTTPGQYVFLNVPELSKTEWHPFTLTSCPEESFHSVHIRVAGDWTQQLAMRLGCVNSSGTWLRHNVLDFSQLPRLRVDGPFGTSSQHAFDHDVAVLVGAGIGVTPFASILKQIWYARRTPAYTLKLKRVYFLWIARDTTSFEWFQDLLHHMELENSGDFLEIQVYLSGNMSLDKAQSVMVNSSSSSGRDPITGLWSRTRFGRPNLSLVLKSIREDVLQLNEQRTSARHAGVFFCGPNSMGNVLLEQCRKQSDSRMRFHFNKEVFN